MNVWENTAADRVSERIIANIFEQPLVVADISDLNPNVMLELGLRLASKKPTVVVVNSGGAIPFDIRDFHAIIYPADLNMLGMEEFFRKLSKTLKEKYQAFTSENYQPFLGSVVVDVISPGHREVSFDEAIVDRLQEISVRLAQLESATKPRPRWHTSDEDDRSTTTQSGRMSYFTTKGDLKAIAREFEGIVGVDSVRILGGDASEGYLAVSVSHALSEDDADKVYVELKILGRRLGCRPGIASGVIRRNKW